MRSFATSWLSGVPAGLARKHTVLKGTGATTSKPGVFRTHSANSLPSEQ